MDVIEHKVEAWLQRLSVAQKIGQLNQVSISSPELATLIRAGQVGTVILAGTAYAGTEQQPAARAEQINALQRLAMDESPLPVPLVFARDCIHGHRTVFPIPLGQAAGWNESLVRDCAHAVAAEATCDGVRWTFAPMIDISRDARWGRVAEGFGEDPVLTAAMGVASVQGFQHNGNLSDPSAVAACAKHYVGYGAPEGGRDYDSCEISVHTLRNIYLPPFKAACDAGVATVMSAFHEIGGEPLTASRHWLRAVLKDEWHWDGTVVSDWCSVEQLIAHGVAADGAAAAEIALLAGNDVDMIDELYHKHLPQLVQSGRVPMHALDDAVRRVLRLKLRLGLFDQPYVDESRAQFVQLSDVHRQLARRAAHHACVLLKNDADLLPLDESKRALLCGSIADDGPLLYGTWTVDGRASDARSIRAELTEQLGERLTFTPHADDAAWRSRDAETVVAVLGESPWRTGEDATVSDLSLPAGQVQMLRAIKARGRRIVAVIIAGRPLAIDDVLEVADAVLWVFHPGTEGAGAIADILLGKAEPLGRLPMTMPRTTGQVPIYYNHRPTGRPLSRESARQRYIDSIDRPLLPFGFGLTFTRFTYGPIALDATRYIAGQTIRASLRLTNVGTRRCSEVLQLYIRGLVAPVSRPVRELKAWQRITLDAGESQTFYFDLPVESLGYLTHDGPPVLPIGRYSLWIAANAEAGEAVQFEVAGK